MGDAIGLADLFGRGEWQPTGMIRDTAHTKSQFQALLRAGHMVAGVNYVELMSAIPYGLVDQFEIERRSQRGFKFEWEDAQGVAWHVHGHEPDAGALAGHAGGQGW